MMDAMYLAGGLERRRFHFAISIRCRGMRFRGRCEREVRYPCRWKMRLRTWGCLKRSSARGKRGGGRNRRIFQHRQHRVRREEGRKEKAKSVRDRRRKKRRWRYGQFC